MKVLICCSADLIERGVGVRFTVKVNDREMSAFVVRFGNQVHGYLNRCAHVPIELDWNEGEFFETSGLYLMCATHGAIYTPDQGKCVGGPCRGASLRKLTMEENGSEVFWLPDDYVQAPEKI